MEGVSLTEPLQFLEGRGRIVASAPDRPRQRGTVKLTIEHPLHGSIDVIVTRAFLLRAHDIME